MVCSNSQKKTIWSNGQKLFGQRVKRLFGQMVKKLCGQMVKKNYLSQPGGAGVGHVEKAFNRLLILVLSLG